MILPPLQYVGVFVGNGHVIVGSHFVSFARKRARMRTESPRVSSSSFFDPHLNQLLWSLSHMQTQSLRPFGGSAF